MATVGQIGNYHWAEFWREEPELYVRDLVRELREFLVGLIALNTGFDSGRLGSEVGPAPAGWRMVGEHAVSPPLDEAALRAWPESGCSFDEWYFLKSTPQVLTRLTAWCNYAYSLSLARCDVARRMENGFDFADQLERVSAEHIIGAGNSIFVLSRSQAVIDTFLALAREP